MCYLKYGSDRNWFQAFMLTQWFCRYGLGWFISQSFQVIVIQWMLHSVVISLGTLKVFTVIFQSYSHWNFKFSPTWKILCYIKFYQYWFRPRFADVPNWLQSKTSARHIEIKARYRVSYRTGQEMNCTMIFMRICATFRISRWALEGF